jgi:hypothetical protein
MYLSRGLSNRAGGHVTSRKVVRVDSTSGRYNLSSIIFLYCSKGFEIVMSLNPFVPQQRIAHFWAILQYHCVICVVEFWFS